MRKNYVECGVVTIYLPDESSAVFSIFEDVATLFDTDYQSQAVDMLKKRLAELPDLKPKPMIDYEADRMQISSRSPRTIYQVAIVINQLAVKSPDLGSSDQETILLQLSEWKRPKPKKWLIGSLFSIPLRDGSYMFGQVIGTHLTKTQPILILFDLRKAKPEVSTTELEESTILTAINADNESLNNGTYHIVGTADPMYEASLVEKKSSHGDVLLLNLGEAYYGLHPWNVLYEETYYDKLLLPGILRPTMAQVLTAEQRAAYRKQHWGL